MSDAQPEDRAPVMELVAVDVPSPVRPEMALVREVNWRVMEGERWLVTGPPAGGKSSVLSVAAGLVRPLRGCQMLFGRVMNEANESEQLEVRLRVGVVFSGGGRLFPHFSVAENVALPVLYHGRDAEPGGSERVERVLVGLGLESCAQRSPRDLPRRLAQRVALARALALEPDLLILDDPTAGLPPAETSWWLRFIEGEMEARPPRTVVVAASDPRDWRGVAERFAWVENRTWHVTTETADVLDRWMRPSAAD